MDKKELRKYSLIGGVKRGLDLENFTSWVKINPKFVERFLNRKNTIGDYLYLIGKKILK